MCECMSASVWCACVHMAISCVHVIIPSPFFPSVLETVLLSSISVNSLKHPLIFYTLVCFNYIFIIYFVCLWGMPSTVTVLKSWFSFSTMWIPVVKLSISLGRVRHFVALCLLLRIRQTHTISLVSAYSTDIPKSWAVGPKNLCCNNKPAMLQTVVSPMGAGN